jgi:flagellar motor switch protein FliN
MSDETVMDEQSQAGWGLLAQIPLRLSVEIGSVSRSMQDLLDLQQGAVVVLDRPIDEPVDILANGTVIARGEVVNAGERYGVRITEIVDAEPVMQRRERRT